MSKQKENNIEIQDTQLATKLVRAGVHRSSYKETSEAIYLNSGFCYDNAETAESRFNGEQPGYVYSRYTNPNLRMLEERLLTLEDNSAEAITTASGMASVFEAIMCDIKPGDHLIASEVLFGSCYYIITQILPRFNVEVTLVNGSDKQAWRDAFKANTSHVFIETPANPLLNIVDIEYVAGLCEEFSKKYHPEYATQEKTYNNGRKIRLIVDNIFAGPLIQAPLALGADTVVYSTTKHMDGQGRTLGGAVICSDKKFLDDILLPFHRHTGPALSPFNAWIVHKALETYDLRLSRQCENALFLAQALEKHPAIERVFYPFLESHPDYEIAKKQMKNGGPMVAFAVKANNGKTAKESSFAFLNNLQIIDISNNLGDSKSLITHPYTTTHSNIAKEEKARIGITDNMLRFSVGIEDKKDLLQDIENSLALI